MIDKCKKALNVMRCLVGSECGASCSSLRNIYLAVIKSAIDYGLTAYGSASQHVLGEIDKVQKQALRICCGVIRTSPKAALQVEMGEIPLEERRMPLKMV